MNVSLAKGVRRRGNLDYAALEAAAGGPLPSAEELGALIARARADDQVARAEAIRRNLRLVIRVAASYPGRPRASFADLVQDGTLGLIRAVDEFDPGRGWRFSTYAVPAIVRAIAAGAEGDGAIRTPKGTPGSGPRGEAAARARGAGSLDQPDRYGDPSGESIPDWRPEADWEDLHELERAAVVREALAAVEAAEPRPAGVLRGRYGIGAEAPLKLREVGERLGVTRERVRQIQDAGLDLVRAELARRGYRAADDLN